MSRSFYRRDRVETPHTTHTHVRAQNARILIHPLNTNRVKNCKPARPTLSMVTPTPTTQTPTGTKLNHAFTFPDVLASRLQRHYKTKLRSKWRSIFASLDAIGNPFLMMESFEKAAKDLISEPMTNSNPIVGVAKGAASFGRNVSHGMWCSSAVFEREAREYHACRSMARVGLWCVREH